jgi:DNA polymerase
MLVGEMPGDREDLAGKPFVGPAGRLLESALAAAGINRAETYITNAVKHFKWEQRGKRRLHRRPTVAEVVACLPWFELEIEVVAPEVLVCLGATATRAVLGPDARIARSRGRFLPSSWAPRVTVTMHPAAVLRIPDRARRKREQDALIADLAFARGAFHPAEARSGSQDR